MTTEPKPRVIQDPRFHAGRLLVQSGQAEEAVTVFAALLQECRHSFGTSIETAPAHYEYGNALFRAYQHSLDKEEVEKKEEEKSKDKDTARNAAAEAAERRANQSIGQTEGEPSHTGEEAGSSKNESSDQDIDDTNAGDDSSDAQLALELMETAWSIMDASIEEETQEYKIWTEKETPRVLTGIGDVLSCLGRHGDAMDAYSRGLGHWQSLWNNADQESIEALVVRRRMVESNVLIAEELLACPQGEDVVTTETKDVLVKAADRVDFVRGYYDKARDELQETVLLMGQLAAKGEDLETEKENVCFASTLVMGVGMSLAELDEAAETEDDAEPVKKKTKT